MEAELWSADLPQQSEGDQGKSSNLKGVHGGTNGDYKPKGKIAATDGTLAEDAGAYLKQKLLNAEHPQKSSKHGPGKQIQAHRPGYLKVPPLDDETNPIESCESRGLKITFRRRSAEKSSSTTNQPYREIPQSDTEVVPEIPKLVVQRSKSPKCGYSLHAKRGSDESTLTGFKDKHSTVCASSKDDLYRGGSPTPQKDKGGCENTDKRKTSRREEVRSRYTNPDTDRITESTLNSNNSEVVDNDVNKHYENPPDSRSEADTCNSEQPALLSHGRSISNRPDFGAEAESSVTDTTLPSEIMRTKDDGLSPSRLDNDEDGGYWKYPSEVDDSLSSLDVQTSSPSDTQREKAVSPELVVKTGADFERRQEPNTSGEFLEKSLFSEKRQAKLWENGIKRAKQCFPSITGSVENTRPSSASNEGNINISLNDTDLTEVTKTDPGDNVLMRINAILDSTADANQEEGVVATSPDAPDLSSHTVGAGDLGRTSDIHTHRLRDNDSRGRDSPRSGNAASPGHAPKSSSRDVSDRASRAVTPPNHGSKNKTPVVVLDRLPSPVLELYSRQSLMAFSGESANDSDMDLSSGEWSPNDTSAPCSTGRLRFTYKKVSEQRRGRAFRKGGNSPREGRDRTSVSEPEEKSRSLKGMRSCTSEKRRRYYMRTSKQMVSYTKRGVVNIQGDATLNQARQRRICDQVEYGDATDGAAGLTGRTANIRTDSGGMRIEGENSGGSTPDIQSSMVDPKVLSMSTALWRSYKGNVAADKLAFRAKKSSTKPPSKRSAMSKTMPQMQRIFNYLSDNKSGYKKLQNQRRSSKTSSNPKHVQRQMNGDHSRGKNKNERRSSPDVEDDKWFVQNRKLSKLQPTPHRNIFNTEIFRQDRLSLAYSADDETVSKHQVVRDDTSHELLSAKDVKQEGQQGDVKDASKSSSATVEVKTLRKKPCPKCRCKCSRNVQPPGGQVQQNPRKLSTKPRLSGHEISRGDDSVSKSNTVQEDSKPESLRKANGIIKEQCHGHSSCTIEPYSSSIHEDLKVVVKQEIISPTPCDQSPDDTHLFSDSKGENSTTPVNFCANGHYDRSKNSSECSKDSDHSHSSTCMLRTVIKREIDNEDEPSSHGFCSHPVVLDKNYQKGSQSDRVPLDLTMKQPFHSDNNLPEASHDRNSVEAQSVEFQHRPAAPAVFNFDNTSVPVDRSAVTPSTPLHTPLSIEIGETSQGAKEFGSSLDSSPAERPQWYRQPQTDSMEETSGQASGYSSMDDSSADDFPDSYPTGAASTPDASRPGSIKGREDPVLVDAAPGTKQKEVGFEPPPPPASSAERITLTLPVPQIQIISPSSSSCSSTFVSPCSSFGPVGRRVNKNHTNNPQPNLSQGRAQTRNGVVSVEGENRKEAEDEHKRDDAHGGANSSHVTYPKGHSTAQNGKPLFRSPSDCSPFLLSPRAVSPRIKRSGGPRQSEAWRVRYSPASVSPRGISEPSSAGLEQCCFCSSKRQQGRERSSSDGEKGVNFVSSSQPPLPGEKGEGGIPSPPSGSCHGEDVTPPGQVGQETSHSPHHEGPESDDSDATLVYPRVKKNKNKSVAFGFGCSHCGHDGGNGGVEGGRRSPVRSRSPAVLSDLSATSSLMGSPRLSGREMNACRRHSHPGSSRDSLEQRQEELASILHDLRENISKTKAIRRYRRTNSFSGSQEPQLSPGMSITQDQLRRNRRPAFDRFMSVEPQLDSDTPYARIAQGMEDCDQHNHNVYLRQREQDFDVNNIHLRCDDAMMRFVSGLNLMPKYVRRAEPPQESPSSCAETKLYGLEDNNAGQHVSSTNGKYVRGEGQSIKDGECRTDAEEHNADVEDRTIEADDTSPGYQESEAEVTEDGPCECCGHCCSDPEEQADTELSQPAHNVQETNGDGTVHNKSGPREGEAGDSLFVIENAESDDVIEGDEAMNKVARVGYAFASTRAHAHSRTRKFSGKGNRKFSRRRDGPPESRLCISLGSLLPVKFDEKRRPAVDAAHSRDRHSGQRKYGGADRGKARIKAKNKTHDGQTEDGAARPDGNGGTDGSRKPARSRSEDKDATKDRKMSHKHAKKIKAKKSKTGRTHSTEKGDLRPDGGSEGGGTMTMGERQDSKTGECWVRW